MENKFAQLKQKLSEFDNVLVAFSGGVDSAFLLWASVDVLGPDQVLAATASSAICFQEEMQVAAKLAQNLGCQHRIVRTDQLEDTNFVENSPLRCYYCKRSIFSRLNELKQQEGFASIIEGSNWDDSLEYRPGAQAAHEFDVRSPLEEVGLTKTEIRLLSHKAGLPTWNQRSQTCLATHIPHRIPITIDVLEQVAQAEAVLGEMGFSTLRVRHHGDIARIEIPPDEFSKITESGAAQRVTKRFKSLGFRYVSLDLDGYHRGSMEEITPESIDGDQ